MKRRLRKLSEAKTIKAFWANINRRRRDQCWLWTGCVTKTGYGRFFAEGKTMRANRIVAGLHRGKMLTNDELACHKCDNPPCCNPDHIFVGTNLDNSTDCCSKQRQLRGEKHHSARMTPSKVATIRGSDKTIKELSKEFGVTWRAIWKIKQRISWKHVS